MMASCPTMPKKGHLDQLYHNFSFLKKKHNSEMVFEPSKTNIDEETFSKQDCINTLYTYCSEEPPPTPQMHHNVKILDLRQVPLWIMNMQVISLQ